MSHAVKNNYNEYELKFTTISKILFNYVNHLTLLNWADCKYSAKWENSNDIFTHYEIH